MIKVPFIKMVYIVMAFLGALVFVVSADVKSPKSPAIGIPDAINFAQEFSREHTKGLKFVRMRKFAGKSVYYLESADATFKIDPQDSASFSFDLKSNALKKLPKKGWLSKEDAKAIALKVVKLHYRDFHKKNMVFGVRQEVQKDEYKSAQAKEKSKLLTAVPISTPPEYKFTWTEHVKIGKYDVAVGNVVHVTVDTERHVISHYFASYAGDLNLDSFKPIMVDENEAKSIAITYLKSKVKFQIIKVQIDGPSITNVVPGDWTSPLKILWDIHIEGKDLKEGVFTGVFIDVDAKTGAVTYFSYGL